MAGDIFVSRCMVFGFAAVMGYWAAAGSRVNFWLCPPLFLLAYVAMAWVHMFAFFVLWSLISVKS